MPQFDPGITATLGLLLMAALAGGIVARAMRLPRVTAYLIVGLLLGPRALGAIPDGHLEFLDPIGKLAMALVLFNMGCHFQLTSFRRVIGSVGRLSLGELGLTFVLVGGGLLMLGESWEASLLFAALALATAPATTMLVLKEASSEGPVTERTIALIALNNLASIVAFEVLFLGIEMLSGKLDRPFLLELARLLRDLLGSIAVGLVAGVVASLGCALASRTRWFILLVALATFVLGLCQQWDIPYLLTFLTMGATVANVSARTREIENELDRFTGLLCVVFFVIHGAEMDLLSLVDAGMIGVGYIALRTAGKYLGALLASDASRDGRDVKRWTGATLLSQAGAAIALSAVAVERAPALGLHLQSIILGTVVFFEIVGPLLVRQAVLRSGEVPLIEAIHHTSTTPLDEVHAMLRRVRQAVGLAPFASQAVEQLTVGQLMRANVEGIPASASFREFVSFIEHSHDNLFAVVNDDGELTGVIRYSNLKQALFLPTIGALVCAADLAEMPGELLHPDDPIEKAWQQFQSKDDDCAPVVLRESPHLLVGMVRRRDLFRLFARQTAVS